jgi:hypothetical protein
METRPSLPEENPACLPLGMHVGAWRIRSWSGQGSYGTVYRAEREGHETSGPGALKLAHYSRDERFASGSMARRCTSGPHGSTPPRVR